MKAEFYSSKERTTHTIGCDGIEVTFDRYRRFESKKGIYLILLRKGKECGRIRGQLALDFLRWVGN